MVLVSMSNMLQDAQLRCFAVGYFESWNLESLRAVICAAEEEKSPVIVGFNGERIARLGLSSYLEYYASVGKAAADGSCVPTVLILNEAKNFEQVLKGLRCGFNCVMLDCSSLPYDKNVKMTKRIVELAHPMAVCVEGQIDKIPEDADESSGGTSKPHLTQPEKAASFVNETDVDALAISVGNVHGLISRKSCLDMERIAMIRELTDVPLVLHGSTGILDEDIAEAIHFGVNKVNLGAALRKTFIDGIKEALDRNLSNDPEIILNLSEKRMKKIIQSKIRVYGSSGKVRS